jgi:hypothetical protein
MLFVEVGVWAHVQCLAWSRGVYEDILSRKLGKVRRFPLILHISCSLSICCILGDIRLWNALFTL